MKKPTRFIDITLVGILLIAFAAPLFAVSSPNLGSAASYTLLDSTNTNSQALLDARSAYNELTAMGCTFDMTRQTLNNQRLAPGVYCFNEATVFNGQVTLDGRGDVNAVFVIKVNGRFDVWGNSSVMLVGGAQPQNVFWVVGGPAVLAQTLDFAGTIIAVHSISFSTNVGSVFDTAGRINGRLWSLSGTVSVPPRVTVGLQPIVYQHYVSQPTLSYQQPVYQQPMTGTTSFIVINNDPNFALFVNGYRVTSGQSYSFAPGTYTVSEVNLSSIEYGDPVWSGACVQSGLQGIVTLNAGEQKTCTVTTPFYSGSTAYVYTSVPDSTTYYPVLPNTGGGGAYLIFMNSAGLLLIAAFAAEELQTRLRLNRARVRDRV